MTLEICWLIYDGTAHNVFLATLNRGVQRYLATIAIDSKYPRSGEFFAREWIKIHEMTLVKFVHEQQQYSIIKECVGGIMSLGIRGWI